MTELVDSQGDIGTYGVTNEHKTRHRVYTPVQIT